MYAVKVTDNYNYTCAICRDVALMTPHRSIALDIICNASVSASGWNALCTSLRLPAATSYEMTYCENTVTDTMTCKQ